MVIGGLAIVSAMYLVELRDASSEPRSTSVEQHHRDHSDHDRGALVLVAFLIIRRQRYVRAPGRGWTSSLDPAGVRSRPRTAVRAGLYARWTRQSRAAKGQRPVPGVRVRGCVPARSPRMSHNVSASMGAPAP